MELYPIMLNIRNRKAIVIGGGRIAYRKAAGLLQAGASVTVISPNLHPQLEQLFAEERIGWLKREFQPSDLAEAMIVIAATNRKPVNEEIAALASCQQLVNVADNHELSNFHVPAALTRGKLTIAVGTGGASPILAQKIRDELAGIYDESFAEYLQFLALAREKIKNSIIAETKKNELLQSITHKNYQMSLAQQKDFLERF